MNQTRVAESCSERVFSCFPCHKYSTTLKLVPDCIVTEKGKMKNVNYIIAKKKLLSALFVPIFFYFPKQRTRNRDVDKTQCSMNKLHNVKLVRLRDEYSNKKLRSVCRDGSFITLLCSISFDLLSPTGEKRKSGLQLIRQLV